MLVAGYSLIRLIFTVIMLIVLCVTFVYSKKIQIQKAKGEISPEDASKKQRINVTIMIVIFIITNILFWTQR